MSFLRGVSQPGGGGSDRGARDARAYVEERRWRHAEELCVASLACPRCDAPVTAGPAPLPVVAELCCPFCEHRAPAREFLSLERPTRPARVVVRVRLRREPGLEKHDGGR
jgi:hypothetical protein